MTSPFKERRVRTQPPCQFLENKLRVILTMTGLEQTSLPEWQLSGPILHA